MRRLRLPCGLCRVKRAMQPDDLSDQGSAFSLDRVASAPAGAGVYRALRLAGGCRGNDLAGNPRLRPATCALSRLGQNGPAASGNCRRHQPRPSGSLDLWHPARRDPSWPFCHSDSPQRPRLTSPAVSLTGPEPAQPAGLARRRHHRRYLLPGVECAHRHTRPPHFDHPPRMGQIGQQLGPLV